MQEPEQGKKVSGVLGAKPLFIKIFCLGIIPDTRFLFIYESFISDN